MIRLLAFLVLAGALTGAAFWVYLRAELPVPGRIPLAGARSTSLVVLLALLFNLRLPWGRAGSDAPRWALLDRSASMSAAGGAAWREATARAEELAANGWTVVPFGEGARDERGPSSDPDEVRTLLAPALARAVESGAREVTVLSDMRFEDPGAAAEIVGSGSLSPSFERFGGAVRNAGLASFSVEDQGRRGDPVGAELELFAEGVSDSIQVEIRAEGELASSLAIAPPAPGRRARVTFELPAPKGEGRVRYTARALLSGDAFPSDDEAVAYMTAGRVEGGVVVVSLRPGWDPRALLAVLREATGARATGYLRAGPDRFVTMGRALERGSPRDSASVRAAAGAASLLVLHGLDARSDAWSRSLARRSGGVLHWPADSSGARAAGVAAGPPRGGEWYVVPEAGPSGLAGELAGATLHDLPPLADVLPVEGARPGSAPLGTRLGGTGPELPALLLVDSAGGRKAIVLSSGFWRWAARDGPPRDAYRRLWSGVAGWLLRGDAGAVSAEVRPERWVVPSRTPMGWRIPSGSADTVRIEIVRGDGTPALDTVLGRSLGTATPALPPGTYRYRSWSGGKEVGDGRFDVEARSEEMLPKPSVPELPEPGLSSGGGGGAGGAPLRGSPWPYLLVLALLSAEWVGRRRAGLR